MRRGYLIALIIALLGAFWSTDRADSALAPWGLNHGDCVQAFGSYYCGDAAEELGQRFSASE